MRFDEARYCVQTAAAKLAASGVFDRHPKPKCLVADVGATWVPFMADHLDKAYGCWGRDYPHPEGTFGRTRKTLHELVADLTPEQRERITKGALKVLFPYMPPAPAGGTELSEDA